MIRIQNALLIALVLFVTLPASAKPGRAGGLPVCESQLDGAESALAEAYDELENLKAALAESQAKIESLQKEASELKDELKALEGYSDDVVLHYAATLLRLRKRPDLLTQEWDSLLDEHLIQLHENPLALESTANANPLQGMDLGDVGDF